MQTWVAHLVEQSYGIGAASHAGQQDVRLPSKGGLALAPGLFADDCLEVPHHHGVGMGAGLQTPGCSAWSPHL